MMTWINKKSELYALLTVLSCIFIAYIVLNPIWLKLELHVPGEPTSKVDFTQPVDTIFYIRNAELGYRWDVSHPTSLWFHPLLSWSVKYFFIPLPANYRLWLISLFSAFGSLIMLHKYINNISINGIKPWMLLIVPLLPGGLGIATGNAEYPCLFFSILLLLSVLEIWQPYYPVIWGTLAILTKPNALYMVPVLGVYLLYALKNKEKLLLRNSVLGVISILFVWFFWIIFVDAKVGQFGAYWYVRQICTMPLIAGPLSFLSETIKVFIYGSDIGEKFKYLSALLIPIIDMWILMFIPLKNEVHRLAILAGIVSILFITLFTNNPNKIVVYVTTFPGHIAIGLLFLRQMFERTKYIKIEKIYTRVTRYSMGIIFLIYCSFMMVFYIVGTPLGWYY